MSRAQMGAGNETSDVSLENPSSVQQGGIRQEQGCRDTGFSDRVRAADKDRYYDLAGWQS